MDADSVTAARRQPADRRRAVVAARVAVTTAAAARLRLPAAPVPGSAHHVELAQVCGQPAAVALVRQLAHRIRHPSLFASARLPNVLLVGPPGTGKTMVARAIASTCHAAFYDVGLDFFAGTFRDHELTSLRALIDEANATIGGDADGGSGDACLLAARLLVRSLLPCLLSLVHPTLLCAAVVCQLVALSLCFLVPLVLALGLPPSAGAWFARWGVRDVSRRRVRSRSLRC